MLWKILPYLQSDLWKPTEKPYLDISKTLL